jgi:alkylhydroperoxidase family enzyme
VEAVLTDVATAPIPEKEKKLFRYVERVTKEAASIREADVGELREAGWSDEAIYDAVTVAALFNFYTRWVDGTGVSDMPAAAYEQAGRRMATGGYLPD